MQEPRPESSGRASLTWSRVLRASAFTLLAVVCAVLIWGWQAGWLERCSEPRALQQALQGLGAGGPMLVIGLMTMAIVMSPIPSAPIALAAGATYGHLWGTLYIVIGSATGAIIAFAIARALGREALARRMGHVNMPRSLERFMGSQNGLMFAVFASRLMPFLSFDLFSYAAGLTSLRPWRFVLATLAGIVPISFLLAHFGETIGTSDSSVASLVVLGLGVLIVLPIAWRGLKSRRSQGSRR